MVDKKKIYYQSNGVAGDEIATSVRRLIFKIIRNLFETEEHHTKVVLFHSNNEIFKAKRKNVGNSSCYINPNNSESDTDSSQLEPRALTQDENENYADSTLTSNTPLTFEGIEFLNSVNISTDKKRGELRNFILFLLTVCTIQKAKTTKLRIP